MSNILDASNPIGPIVELCTASTVGDVANALQDRECTSRVKLIGNCRVPLAPYQVRTPLELLGYRRLRMEVLLDVILKSIGPFIGMPPST